MVLCGTKIGTCFIPCEVFPVYKREQDQRVSKCICYLTENGTQRSNTQMFSILNIDHILCGSHKYSIMIKLIIIKFITINKSCFAKWSKPTYTVKIFTCWTNRSIIIEVINSFDKGYFWN